MLLKRLMLGAVLGIALAHPAVAGLLSTPSGSPHDDGYELLRQSKSRVLSAVGQDAYSTLAESTHAYDVLHYALDITVDIDGDSMFGQATITAASEEDGLDSLDLHLEGLEVDRILSGEDTLAFSRLNDTLKIDLGATYSTGDTFDVRVDYHGVPLYSTYVGGFDITSDVSFTFNEPIAARRWFPCFDEPRDKATLTMSAAVPPGYIVASNGLLIDVRSTDQYVVYTYEETHPIATYLISLAIDDYAVWSDWHFRAPGDSVEIIYYAHPWDSANAAISWDDTPNMVDFFASVFGPYPFDKYGMAEAPIFNGWGAMEHQTCTTYGHMLVNGGHSYDWIVAHELAHQWWGDWVTLLDWRHIWLNEGFATYGDALYVEHRDGDAAFRGRMQSFANTYFYEDNSIRYPIFDPPPGYLFGACEYEKGAWVLHMMRYIFDDDSLYFEAIRNYGDTYGGGVASTDDLQAEFEALYGDSLDWFFQQWIYQAGHPEFEISWTAQEVDQGPYEVEIVLHQVQEDSATSTPIFEMPAEILVIIPGEDSLVSFRFDSEYDTVYAMVDSMPTGVYLDPNTWLLHQVVSLTDVGDQTDYTSSACSIALLQNAPNPFSHSTTISYMVYGPADESRIPVTLSLYNIQGQHVRTLVDARQSHGPHTITWDGRDDRGRPVSSGVYFFRLEAPGHHHTRKIVLVH
ncbi:hypothetical protein AMJ82_03035 [candidate division TA06 bacterium SM23_40]|uniref:Aminopeptidase N n=1 Tax=candidate division TA06 bacterium SM23_40 TaxID=1703774 RepID=A0A0S8GBP0_UNCT6|nr:MAG: hypothetical protein AMJ82_03035 [candidate division TA06 bacterium SM23_40]